jgi:acyl dehydratase
MQTTLRYFEDLHVGDRFGSDEYTITANAMKEFAREFDPQPFHIDEAAADASDFAGLTASGWYTAAVAMRLFVTGELQFAGGAIGLGVEELRWPQGGSRGRHVASADGGSRPPRIALEAEPRHRSPPECRYE